MTKICRLLRTVLLLVLFLNLFLPIRAGAEEMEELELVIFKRGSHSLRFSYMMKGTGLTEFGIGTPRPQLNVSATLHHSAFDLASWDRVLLPFYAPI